MSDIIKDVWRVLVYTMGLSCYGLWMFDHMPFETAIMLVTVMVMNIVLLND